MEPFFLIEFFLVLLVLFAERGARNDACLLEILGRQL